MRSTAGSTHRGGHWTQTAPPAPVFAASFFLAGLGTVVLGPLLPRLLLEWHLSDQRGGLLLLAKFAGAFAGGAAVLPRLRLGLVGGHLLAAFGLAAFAFTSSIVPGALALFLAGIGLGEMIASANILAGRRWHTHTGAALALLNFFWSLGAVSTGVLVAALLPSFGWRRPLLGLAGLLVLTGCALLLPGARRAPAPEAAAAAESETCTHTGRDVGERKALLYFGLLLLLYGGLETCLTAWISTFTLRVSGGALLGGQSGFVVLWVALTAGRLLASGLMRRWPEDKVQRASLLCCCILIGILAFTRGGLPLAGTCTLLGLALAPIFPSTFGLFLQRPVPARVAGIVLAVSGLGAALFPWLMGVVSTHSGSLRVAMAVPALLSLAMLVLSRNGEPRQAAWQHPRSEDPVKESV